MTTALLVRTWKHLAGATLCAALVSCATAPASKPDDLAATTNAPAGDVAATGDAAAAPKEGDGDLTPTKDDQEKAAAELRAQEERELAAKEAERKAAEERRKANEAKLNAAFESAFDLIKGGKEDEAFAAYQKAAEEVPDGHAAQYNLAVMLERRGDREGAVKAYEKALSLKPDYVEASENLTRLLLRSKMEQKAESDLRKRILANPRSVALRNQLVRVMVSAGREQQAENESKKVLKVDERNTDAMLNLASIWYGQKKFELAKQVLDNAKEIDPNDPAIWNMLAFCQLALEQKPLALESFRKAAALREDFPEAHNNYGAMLNEVNDCDSAIRELELAVRYSPESASTHLNLGNAYRCARRYPEAQKLYEKALTLDPSGADPYFNLAILYLDSEVAGDDAKPMEKLPRLQAALAYFEKYKAGNGDDPRLDRYFDENRKAIDKEQARLTRVAEQKRKSEEKAAREAEKKRLAEEKAKAENEKKLAAAEAGKVQGKSDLEEDGVRIDAPPAPKTAPAPAPAAVAPAPAPTAPPKVEREPAAVAPAERVVPKLEKIGGKEE
jgi:Flp pilus assembly protein TadD